MCSGLGIYIYISTHVLIVLLRWNDKLSAKSIFGNKICETCSIKGQNLERATEPTGIRGA